MNSFVAKITITFSGTTSVIGVLINPGRITFTLKVKIIKSKSFSGGGGGYVVVFGTCLYVEAAAIIREFQCSPWV